MENSKISWTDHTFNPWIGCAEVSPGCDACYARELMQTRFGRAKWGPNEERVRTSPANWKHPLRWNREAAASGKRPFVFGGSLCDWADNKAPAEWRRDYFDLIRATPNLVWLLLTKRPGNAPDMIAESGGLPANVALGATACNQAEYDRNARDLLAIRGALFYFLSCEPLLDHINLRGLFHGPGFIEWLIAGGETNQGAFTARKYPPEAFEFLQAQCAEAETLFHFKQWGSWGPDGVNRDAAENGNVLLGRTFEGRPRA